MDPQREVVDSVAYHGTDKLKDKLRECNLIIVVHERADKGNGYLL